MKKDIKILIAIHKPISLPHCQQFYGIQVGQNFNPTGLDTDSNIYYTDRESKDNISDKNWFYCELTAQYYAYKHLTADYFGCMHYRRFFSFIDIQPKHSYTGLLIEKKRTNEKLDKYKINSSTMQSVIEQYDIIVPKPFYYSMNLYQHFGMNHNIKALNITLKILYQKYPHMWKDTKTYLKQDYGYFCNMFIMKESIFKEYSAWLFDILFTFEKELEKENGQPLKDFASNARLGGYIAELLCGIYINALIKKNKLKILQLPIVYFDKKYSLKKKLAGIAFPVHSKRRKFLDNYIHKRIIKKRKNKNKYF